MAQRHSPIPSRASSSVPPFGSAGSRTTPTTPFISAPVRATSAPVTGINDREKFISDKILPARSVVRPVSRWWGPFRKNFPQHQIYRGAKYWEKGFKDIKFVIENYVDWRDKPEMIHLVDASESFILELAVIRERLDLEECRMWKRKVRTFMITAETSSQQAQAGSLRELTKLAAKIRSSSGASNCSEAPSAGGSKPWLLPRLRESIESRPPGSQPFTTSSPIADSQGPFADPEDTGNAAMSPVSPDTDAQMNSIPISGDSIEMAIFNATAAWVEATAHAGSGLSGLQHTRSMRRVASLPSM